jgi:hypothetical protein
MSISTADCKQAIVDFIRLNPGHVSSQFCDVAPNDISTFEAQATKTNNWKRFEKERVTHGQFKGMTRRGFNCNPYDDQLRAYVWDDGNTILRISIEGE